MNFHQFSFPTSIYFGSGVSALLSKILGEKKIKKPLLLTDRGISQLPIFKKMLEMLKTVDVEVYNDFEGNPVDEHVKRGVQVFKTHHSDGIIALGGGAAIDVAKAVALMVNHPGKLFDYEDGLENARPVDQEVPKIIAIPTTAGTGSEVGRAAVISDNDTKAKKIVFSPKLLPEIVLADPMLTVELPSKLTAATGMDALSHCVEAYLAKGYHPMCDGIAIEGIGLVAHNLALAVREGGNIKAREAMLMASMMGAVAFQKGLGVIHSCAHALSSVCDLHHGLANGIMMPYCMEFNLSAAEGKFKRMARVVGARTHDGVGFIAWLKDLRKEIGIPEKLSRLGIQSSEPLIKAAYRDPCHQLNARDVSLEDFQKIFSCAE